MAGPGWQSRGACWQSGHLPLWLLLAVQPQQDRRVLRVTGAGRTLPGGSLKAACCPRPHAVARASDRGRAGSAPGLRGPHGARLLPRGMGWLPPHPFSDLHNEGLRAPWDRECSVNQSLDSLQARGSWEKQTGNEKNTRTKHPSEGGESIQKRDLGPEGGPSAHACWGRGESPGSGLSRSRAQAQSTDLQRACREDGRTSERMNKRNGFA